MLSELKHHEAALVHANAAISLLVPLYGDTCGVYGPYIFSDTGLSSIAASKHMASANDSFIYVYVYVCVCMYMCVSIYVCVFICMYVCVCVYTSQTFLLAWCVCVFVCVCGYISYVYTYVCAYIYIQKHI